MDNILQFLRNSKVRSLRDFFGESLDKLCKLTNLTAEEVRDIRKQIINEYDMRLTTGVSIYQLDNQTCHLIPTGIKSLDELLEGGLQTGYVIDICGLSASGKSQLCNAIAVNAAKTLGIQILYIDTKHDFSGIRIRNLLRSKKISDNNIGMILQLIRVERVYFIEKLLDLLRNLLENPSKIKRLKMVVIDSLPSLIFHYHGECKYEGLSLLIQVTYMLRQLAHKHQITILVINLANSGKWLQLEDKNEIKPQAVQPLLGKYWQALPGTRLLVVRATNNELSASRPLSVIENSLEPMPIANALYHRCLSHSLSIKVVKSDVYETGKCCLVEFGKLFELGDNMIVENLSTQ